ncbi:MAG TPA: 50S ribosomal protein L9 [Phycisphaerae bacterium]|nr:50S ribosomal protein L9 [Phycisphaerae bacterium]
MKLIKVLLRRNVPDLGKIGDLVEVKPGYARNYLLPQGLAYQPTVANIRQVEVERKRYLEVLARQRAEIQARAELVDGKEITIAARANEEGHLYGSVGPAQLVAALAEAGQFVEVSNVVLDEPIRQLDKYEVKLDFGHDVTATIHVWIVPVYGDDETEDPAHPGSDADEEAAAAVDSADEAE